MRSWLSCLLNWEPYSFLKFWLLTLLSMQAEHLKHWGINMLDLQKTEKTMAELQINLNMSYEFDKITESGAHLQPLSGPGWALLNFACQYRIYLALLHLHTAHRSFIQASIDLVPAKSLFLMLWSLGSEVTYVVKLLFYLFVLFCGHEQQNFRIYKLCLP